MKKITGLLLVCLFISLFGGCSTPSDAVEATTSQPTQQTAAATDTAKSESIVIWTNFKDEAALLQEYADSWGKETGNTATVTNTSIEVQEFAQATGTKDGPDGIFGIANDQMATFVAAGLVSELPSDFYNDADYVSAAVQACYVDGLRYGVPIAAETVTLFYNTDKVQSAPATWDDLLKVAATSGGIKFDATSVYYDLGFIRAFGGYIFKWENNAYNVEDIGLNNEGAVKAYTYIQSMADAGFLTADISYDIARSAFENGETAFYIGGPWDVEAFTTAGLHFAVTKMPTLNGKPFVTPVGIQVGFVSSKTEKSEAVLDFYQYLMKNAPAKLYEVGSRIPASLSAQKQISIDDTTRAFMDQIANGEPMPSVPELGQIWTPYSDNMKLMFQGQTKPEEAANYITEQFKEAIALMDSGSQSKP